MTRITRLSMMKVTRQHALYCFIVPISHTHTRAHAYTHTHTHIRTNFHDRTVDLFYLFLL